MNFGYEAYKGGWGFVLNNANWPQLPIAYEIHSYGIVNTLLHTFSPTLVGELTIGLNHGKQTVEPLTQADLEHNDRTQVGLASLPQFYPAANPSRIIPNASFGASGLAFGSGTAPIATLGVEGRYPFFGQNDIWNSSFNLTKVMGPHNVKVGLFFEHTTRPAARSAHVQRSLQLRPQYRQPPRHESSVCQRAPRVGQQLLRIHAASDADARFTNLEWFVQDNWRLKKNFTIDAGLRFYCIGPTTSKGDQLAVFLPDQFNASQAPLLIQPTTRRAAAVESIRSPAKSCRRSTSARSCRTPATCRMASRSSTRGCSTRHPSRWRRASGSRGM